MANTQIGRTQLAILINKTGGSVAQGDVVVVDIANESAFVTDTGGAFVAGLVGVVYEPNGIADDAQGLIAFGGYVPKINLSGTGDFGDLVKTHTVAGEGVRHAAPQVAGDFAQVLGDGAMPAALLFGNVQLGAGGGGSGVVFYDRRWVRGSTANALDDEYNDGAIAGAWGRVDAGGHSGYVTWTEAGDSLSVLIANSADAAAELHAYLQAAALSIGDVIQCQIRGGGDDSNYPIGGLIIADGNTYGAGTQAFFPYFLSSGAPYDLSRSEWSHFDTRAAFADASSGFFGTELFMRIKYSAANTFEYYYSPDGISWILIGSRTITMTPSHIGVAVSSYGSSTPFVWSFEHFRVNP